MKFKNNIFKTVHYLTSKYIKKKKKDIWSGQKQTGRLRAAILLTARPILLVGGWGQRRAKSTLNAKKGEEDLLVRLQVGILIIPSFACGRPPPLEASHSVPTDGAAQTMAVGHWGEANFHVCSDTKHWAALFSWCHGLFLTCPLCLIPSFCIPFSPSGYGFAKSAWRRRLFYHLRTFKLRQGVFFLFFFFFFFFK